MRFDGSEPIPDHSGHPQAEEALRSHMQAMRAEYDRLRQNLQAARQEAIEQRERIKAHLMSAKAQVARSRDLCKVLFAGRGKHLFEGPTAVAEEFGQRHELALVANHVSDALLLLRVDLGGGAPSYHVLYLNPAAERLLGRQAAELTGRRFEEVWTGPALAIWTEKFDETVRSCAALEFESAGPIPDKVLEIRLEPILGPQARCAHILCLSRDITQRKQAEQALQDAKAAAEEAKAAAERANQAKDQFLATLSHELRTPITPVLMLSQQLEQEPDLSPDLRADMKTIRQGVQLEARLIDDLLDLTRIARGKITLRHELVDVHERLQHAMQTCCDEDFASRGLEVQWQLGAASHFVSADAARLEQVFWNLFKNAIKFTPRGGTITIRTRDLDTGRISIEVIDTGKGIEPDKLTAIFNPFDQGGTETTQRYGGLGLGLAIAKAVTDLHGGTITAASDGPGKGAMFTVTLAVAAGVQREAATPAHSGLSTQDSGLVRPARILLVEDHQTTALVLKRFINRWGWEAVPAGSIRSALDAAERQSFDLVISDLGLPDGSGHELMRQLRDRYGLKGIALSGYGMESDIQNSLSSGFVLHLVKPLNFDELRHAVTAFLAGAAHDRGFSSPSI